ncbi:MAG: anhydro-N-acetylmuramic acid kinase [Chloroflexota bacterium]
MFVIGLMSGTSADGTDVCIAEINGVPPQLTWHIHHFTSIPHPENLRNNILTACQPATSTVDTLCTLNIALGEQFALAIRAALNEASIPPEQVTLVGSHGQTVWHMPNGSFPGTLQLGEAAIIAERTGIATVSNFRARDMAAGGQGAPLVPYVDHLLLSHPNHIRAAQNIGGIGNVTFLPSASSSLPSLAFDTGPGNVLLDHTAEKITEGAWKYDRDGRLASQGNVHQNFLDELLKHPYLKQNPPKSTGRELYSATYADKLWQEAQTYNLTAEDLMATLTAFTAQSIAKAYRDFLPHYPDEVIVSGGGAQNPTLISHLREYLKPAKLFTSDDFGIPSEAKEALAFAILAYETWHKRPGNLPSATGARHPVILGQITW